MSRNPRIIIVAMTEQHLIGAGGRIPWQIPEELQLFRKQTSGHTLIMGRHTYASIGRPLPDRRTIVVSRRLPPTRGIEVCADLSGALRLAECDSGKIFFAGGVGIYRAALPLADELSISWIRGEYAGDTYFPPFAEKDWKVVNEHDYGLFRHVRYRRN